MSDVTTIIISWFALGVLHIIFSFTARVPILALNEVLSKYEILLTLTISCFTRITFNFSKLIGIKSHFLEPRNNIFATCFFFLLYILCLSKTFIFDGLNTNELAVCFLVLRVSVLYWLNVSIELCLETYFSMKSPKQDFALYNAFYYLGYVFPPILLFFLDKNVDYKNICQYLMIPLISVVIMGLFMKAHKGGSSHPPRIKGFVHKFAKLFPLVYGNFAFEACVSYFYPLLIFQQDFVKDVFFILSILGFILGLGLGGICTDKYQMRKMLIYLSRIAGIYSLTLIHRTDSEVDLIFLAALSFVILGFSYGTHLVTSYGEAFADYGTKQTPAYLLNIAQGAGGVFGMLTMNSYMENEFWNGEKICTLILGSALLIHIFLHFLEEHCQKKLDAEPVVKSKVKETTATDKKNN